jgi:UDP-N-acetyl-D-mannosaminuronate dehydrogenase
MPDFIATTMEYIEEYKPSLTIIHSTIAPGTTRRIQQAAGNYPVAYSPVLGKHARMEEDMRRYTKFAAATDPETLQMALDHLAAASFRTAAFRTPEVGELSKLLETTYLGVLIGWAQEVERFAGQIGSSHQEVNAFIEEIEFLPSHIFPGFIGGRCVVPNIKILQTQFQSAFLDAVIESNELKKRQQKVLVAAMG